MLAVLAEQQGLDWSIRTAGTHAVEGSAISGRTRDAMAALEDLEGVSLTRHRSHQITEDDVTWADVILAFEADHVNYVRRTFPDGASRTVLLGQFVRHAELDGEIEGRVAAVAAMEPDRSLEVADPAGGDQLFYDNVARQTWDLAQAFATLVSDD
jgi:protein-tyrosine-phosphatase